MPNFLTIHSAGGKKKTHLKVSIFTIFSISSFSMPPVLVLFFPCKHIYLGGWGNDCRNVGRLVLSHTNKAPSLWMRLIIRKPALVGFLSRGSLYKTEEG